MNSYPLISVIMSVYKEEREWLVSSIQSILDQTVSDFEFIIILDFPNSELLKTLKDFEKKDSRIIIYQNEKNVGLVESLNTALSFSRGKYIARMDADDISHKNRFEKQLKYITLNNLDLVGGNVNIFHSNKGIYNTTDKVQSDYFLCKLLKIGTIGIVHPTFFSKRNVYDTIGGYYHAECEEDLELLMRANLNGFKIGNIPDVILDCRYSEKSITKENAYFMFCTVKYLKSLYRSSLKSGDYKFNSNYIELYLYDENNKLAFSEKQNLMSEARHSFNEKKYISFLINLIKSILISRTVFFSIKVNVMSFLFRKVEVKIPKVLLACIKIKLQ